MRFFEDRLILTPDAIDLSRSPLRGHFAAQTYVLGAFNPGLTRLENGNLLLMVRIAEALKVPVSNGSVHAIRWAEERYVIEDWPLEHVDRSDPRTLHLKTKGAKTMALTSLSWLLPVELSPDGLEIIAIHYDKALSPQADFQAMGIEDPRISYVDGRYIMTTCCVSPQRQSTALYSSVNGLDWVFAAMVLDHQNKDMVIFQGLIDGYYWAQTRPLGDVYFAYPPQSPWRSGPSIHLARSKDARFWQPHDKPGLRLSAQGPLLRMGAGAPPILTSKGWLSLWHGVAANDHVGSYKTYWSLLEAGDPSVVVAYGELPVLKANPKLTDPYKAQLYLHDVVFTTGMADAGDHFILASGEADYACRITHVPKSTFGL
jgi:beta-1,2-mannobiose phosphorylase / 1,2-beta-oligomannan phosphorylase